jgi:hypothetical protein
MTPQKRAKQVEHAKAMLEAHPDFAKAHVETYEQILKDNKAAQRLGVTDAGSDERLTIALELFDIRANAYLKLVDNLQLQKAYVISLSVMVHSAWQELTGQPLDLELLPLLGDEGQKKWRAILARLHHWENEGFKRLMPKSGEPTPKAENVGGTVPVIAAKGAETNQEKVAMPGNVPSGTDLKARCWEDIDIVFLSELKVQITINSQPQPPQNYAEMGFDNKKNKNPVAAWETFRELAQHGGVCRVAANGKRWGQIEKRMQEIRKAFRCRYALPGDPIPFSKKTPQNREDFGYRAKFRIRCHPASDA